MKIEILLRMLDNDSLDSDTVFGITDDFQFYLDKADEGLFEDVGYVYEGINLEEVSKYIIHHFSKYFKVIVWKRKNRECFMRLLEMSDLIQTINHFHIFSLLLLSQIVRQPRPKI